MNDIHKRTRFLVETLGPNPNAFAVKTGILAPAVHYVIGTIKRKSKPGFSFIYKVLAAFPEVSPYWYILGEGKWNENNRKLSKSNKFNELLFSLKEENKTLKVLYLEEKLSNEKLKRQINKLFSLR